MDTRLKELRQARGWKSARAFAESIGMQEKTYRNYEQGVRNLYLDVACQLADALECTLDELAGRDFPADRQPSEIETLYARMDDDSRSALLTMARNSAALSGVREQSRGRAAEGAVR